MSLFERPQGPVRLAILAAAACLVSGSALADMAVHGQPGSHPREAAHAHGTPWGEPGDPARADRTIVIAMDDTMRYSPSEIRVKAGETVRIVAENRGKVAHELVIGTPEELREHAEEMRESPHMAHGDPNTARAQPGTTSQIVWRFTRPGELRFACLEPGHYEAGMAGTIRVSR
jgi:uncharacterized cupredoxin-like copper-binding protein